MTLDETIVHEKELGKEIYVESMLCHANPDDELAEELKMKVIGNSVGDVYVLK